MVLTAGVPQQILNAKNDEAEAAIIAHAGRRCAVTISTNMAGRGTDIPLGPGVAELGGLYVIGTNRHEARRIDNQLRGRAGRQGDRGHSQFLVSLEDDLISRYGIRESLSSYSADRGQAINHVQRIIEGQNLEIRQTLWKYESLIEWQRRAMHDRRMQVLRGKLTCLIAALTLNTQHTPHQMDHQARRARIRRNLPNGTRLTTRRRGIAEIRPLYAN